MSVIRKTFFLIIVLAFAAQISNAQSGWVFNKSGGSGDLVTVFFTSSERGFVAGDDGYLAFTVNGGRTWVKQSVDTKDSINEIYFRSKDNGYLVAGKKMFLTDDGGGSWHEIKIYNPGDFKNAVPEFLSIRFADKKRGLIVGSLLDKDEEVVDSLVMRTDDGGETWSRILVPSKRELFHLDFVNSSRGWIVGDKGIILVTYDGGLNWQIQKSGTTNALYNVDFRDSDEGYAVGGKGAILRTENGGNNWETVATTFPETFLRVDFADDKTGWIVGYKGTILRSEDRGKTWVQQELNAKANLYGLFITKKFGWAVGADGLIVEYDR